MPLVVLLAHSTLPNFPGHGPPQAVPLRCWWVGHLEIQTEETRYSLEYFEMGRHMLCSMGWKSVFEEHCNHPKWFLPFVCPHLLVVELTFSVSVAEHAGEGRLKLP